MKKEILLPAAAVAGGAAGFVLRTWELSTAFEPDTGLPISGVPATYLLAALTAAMVLVLAVLCRDSYERISREDDSAFAAPGLPVYPAAAGLSALLLLAGGLALGWDFLHGASAVFTHPILAVLAVVSGVCLLLLAKSRFHGVPRPRYDFLQLMPAYTCCVWLVSSYQMRAGDPVQLDYIYQLAAIIASLLGLYYCAGFSFGKGKPFQACLFSLLGVYGSIVTLADGHDLANTLLYLSAILYLLVSAAVLLRSAAQPSGSDASPARKINPAENLQKTEGIPDEP